MLYVCIYAVIGIIFAIYAMCVLVEYGDIKDSVSESGWFFTVLRALLFAIEMAVGWPIAIFLIACDE